MNWSLANIDWPAICSAVSHNRPKAAAVAAVVVAFVFTAVQGDGSAIKRVFKPFKWRNWTLAILAAGGVGLVAGVALTKGLFDSDTAAWIQGVGSVAAIGAAIWIDQRAAKRLREDREAEWARQRQERENATAAARAARVQAVQTCRDVLGNLHQHLLHQVVADGAGLPVVLPKELRRALVASVTVVTFRLQRPGEIDASVMALLALADQTMGRVIRLSGIQNGWTSGTQLGQDTEVVLAARDDVAEMLAQYQQGVL